VYVDCFYEAFDNIARNLSEDDAKNNEQKRGNAVAVIK
jgi:hypothetical protein